MPDSAELTFRLLCSEYYESKDCLDSERKIVINEISNNNGVIGFIITMTGSPPNALFWVKKYYNYQDATIVSLRDDKIKQLSCYGIQAMLRANIDELVRGYKLNGRSKIV